MGDFKIVIFPEGGIPAAGARFPFKAGAFELAIRTGAPILPVAIHGSADVLPPRGRLGLRPGKVCIQALSAISTDGLTLEDLSGVRGEAERAILAALNAARPPPA
jgi:1-acyl-sn-glycerol-3-phosphate acyltransferase